MKSLVSLVSLKTASFGLTLLVLRLAPPTTFSSVHGRLELYRSFVIFGLVDPLKRAWLSNATAKARRSGLALLALPFLATGGLSVAVILAALSRSFLKGRGGGWGEEGEWGMTWALLCYTQSLVLEMYVEPLVHLASVKSMPVLKGEAESMGNLSKSMFLVLFLLRGYQGGAGEDAATFIVMHGLAQLVYSVVYAMWVLRRSKVLLAEENKALAGFRSFRGLEKVASALRLRGDEVMSYAQSSIFHHALTELDKLYLTSAKFSSAEVTTYQIASSYGSIIPRLILAPITDIFSAMLYSAGGPEKRREALGLFAALCVLLTLAVVSFGPVYIGTILDVLKPNATSELHQLVSTYMYYIGVLSLNTVFETYMHIAISAKSLSVGHGLAQKLLSSAAFAIVAWWAEGGIIVGNICSMMVRVVYSVFWIALVDPAGALELNLKVVTLAYSAACFVIVRVVHFDSKLRSFAFGCAMALSLLLVVGIFEKPFIMNLLKGAKDKGKKSD